jgi:hypothetical protein
MVTDIQTVGETEDTLFTMIQQGHVEALVTLNNAGVNTINYRFQEYNGSTWVNLGSSGSDFYNTLIQSQTRSIKLSSNYPKVRLYGNASGGSTLTFTVLRFVTREDGGSIPILTF